LANKIDQRASALARRDALDADWRTKASLRAAEFARAILQEAKPAIISGYWPIRSELDPRPMLDIARACGHTVALPVLLDSDTLRFRLWADGNELVRAGFGTIGPGADAPEVVPDIMLLPLAAFDRSGHRIGYGKGHYDRALARLATLGHLPLLIGLAFAVQEVDKVAFEPHDIPLDFIVTEEEPIAASPRD
jgi:5-formyltetrahydrofolate cyclo-ligase